MKDKAQGTLYFILGSWFLFGLIASSSIFSELKIKTRKIGTSLYFLVLLEVFLTTFGARFNAIYCTILTAQIAQLITYIYLDHQKREPQDIEVFWDCLEEAGRFTIAVSYIFLGLISGLTLGSYLSLITQNWMVAFYLAASEITLGLMAVQYYEKFSLKEHLIALIPFKSMLLKGS